MATPSGIGVKFVSILLVAVFLVSLGFLPNLIRKTRFSFSTQTSEPGEKSQIISLDRVFSVVFGGSGLPQKTTFGELMKDSPRGVIVNLWATWCPPCLDELPSLEFLNRQLKRSKDLPRLVTVSVDENAQDVNSLFETMDFKPSLLVLHDPLGAFSQKLGTTRFPETYWISPKGEVLYKWVGPQNWLSEEVLSTLKATR